MGPAPLPAGFLATGASRTRVSRAQASSRQGATMWSVAVSQSAPSNPVHSPYTELKRRIEAAGLMRKHPGYYTLMLVTNTLFFGVCLWVLALVHSWWATVLVAPVLGFPSCRLGFHLHDSWHRPI